MRSVRHPAGRRRAIGLALLATTLTGCPRLVGFVAGVGTARGVAVANGLAFVASDPFGLSVINVANPAQRPHAH